MHETDAGPDYYTIEEVADVLGVSTDTIRRRIRSGQLQAVKREASDIPGHGLRWYIPKRSLGMQEVTDVIQVPHALSLNDFDMIITARLEAILNERDERLIQLLRQEVGAEVERALEDQLRTTNRRLEGLDRTLRALPAPATPETITELQTQVNDIKTDLAGIKDSIGNIAINAQVTADDVKTLLPTEDIELEDIEPEKEEIKSSRWQRFKNRFSRQQ
ncbi:MAG: helix-turn-helix domain-containing protein [Halobacteriota archaeon]